MARNPLWNPANTRTAALTALDVLLAPAALWPQLQLETKKLDRDARRLAQLPVAG